MEMNKVKKLIGNKKTNGILLAIIFSATFIAISLVASNFFSGTSWFIFSSVLRLLFGIAILLLVWKIYGKSPKKLLTFTNTKFALFSGIGFMLYFVYYLIDYAVGFESVAGLSVGIVLSRILLQQITTGFYEELNYRVLILEGYNYGEKTVRRKVIYALISFVIFALIHVISGWSTFRFMQTGAIGFALAVIYLNTGNIIIPMILHFIYDIFANLAEYVTWKNSEIFTNINSVFSIALFIMFVISFALLFKIDMEKT